MQKHRIISLASVLAMIAIPVLGFLLFAQPQLNAMSDADQQRADMEGQIAAAAAAVAQLKSDSQNMAEISDDLNTLRRSIPADVDSSGYIDGLDALAKRAQVSITGLTVGDATNYAPPAPPVVAAPDAEGSESPDPSASATPAPPAPAQPGVVTNPLIDSTNFVTIPVTVRVSGTSAQILKFVQGVQSSPRLFLVTTFTTEELSGGLSATIGGFIYAIPTGTAGNPHPISTVVKSMEPPAPPETETETDGDGTPDPNSTETPSPGATDAPTNP